VEQAYLEKIAPTWANVSINMKDDSEADTTFGWVLEMYGYATASALHDVQHILVKDFMLQVHISILIPTTSEFPQLLMNWKVAFNPDMFVAVSKFH
jgi:hypothetical protein